VYLGIDVGTSSVKVVLLDQDLKMQAQACESLALSHPKPLWSEQNPEDWWLAVDKAVATLPKDKRAKITAIGLTGQMHGAVLLDKNNQVLRPAILWNDGRSAKECEQIVEAVSNASDITGNLVMPGFTAPKLLWVKHHEPEIFKQLHKVLLPKDYIRFCLSGDYATDLSDASGTSWLNVKKRTWSQELLAACDLTVDHMPTLHEGTETTGVVSDSIAKKWGIPKNTPIVAGGGDNAASAISVDVVNKGDAFLSLGTSGVLFAADDAYHANPEAGIHTMCHCLPNKWHEMAVHLNAAGCLSWLANLLKTTVAELMQDVEKH